MTHSEQNIIFREQEIKENHKNIENQNTMVIPKFRTRFIGNLFHTMNYYSFIFKLEYKTQLKQKHISCRSDKGNGNIYP